MGISDKKFDVAIVGAGPAGSSLAIRLAMAGMRVVLVEQKKFPREKLCGEFISPECLVHFKDLGVMPELDLIGGTALAETIFFARNGKGVSIKSEWFGSSHSTALGVSRAVMDEALMQRARIAGVDVLDETTVTGLISYANKISGVKLRSKHDPELEIHSSLVVDATGRSRAVARKLENKTVARKPAQFVAFKTHLLGANVTSGACEIYAYRGGYGGCNRVENDLYNLCFIASASDTKRLNSDADRVMREVVFSNTRAAESMKNADVAKPWLAVPIERFGRGELVPANGLLAVGDSAAFIDPFTGSGILLALESAKILSRMIIEHREDFAKIASAYRQSYAASFDRRLRVCSMLRHAAFVPFLAEATISLLGISVGLRRLVARSTRFNAATDV